MLWVANLALSKCQDPLELQPKLNQVELELLELLQLVLVVLLEQVLLGHSQLEHSHLNQLLELTLELEQICRIHL